MTKNLKIEKIKKKGLLFFLIFSLAYSFEIPQKPSGYVNDYANIFSPQFFINLGISLAQFENKTGTQIVVVTIPSLDGEEIESFSIKLAEKWKVGQKELDNGVIIILAVKERKIRIEVGYGLEDKLTDALSSAIINNYMIPYFKNGDFEKGIEIGIQKIIEIITDKKEDENKERRNVAYTSSKKENNYPIVIIVLAIFMFILIIDLLRYRSVRHLFTFWEWFFLFSITYLLLRLLSSFVIRGYGGGSGGFRSYSSGGFSGGGGRFGGGGASGRW